MLQHRMLPARAASSGHGHGSPRGRCAAPSTQITRDRDHAVNAADTHSSHKIFGLPSGIAFIVL